MRNPPWWFKTFSHKGEGRSAVAHYDCLSFADLCNLPVRDHATPDCCLLLWVTDPMLERGLELISSWGFTYKTVAFTWAKLNRSVIDPLFCERDFFAGMGYWTRANPEQCLLATTGSPKRRSKAVRQLIVAPRREHSRKPDEVYARIEDLVSGPYLELFARSSRPGWTARGDQVGLFDGGHVTTRRFPSTLAYRAGLQRDPLDRARTIGATPGQQAEPAAQGLTPGGVRE